MFWVAGWVRGGESRVTQLARPPPAARPLAARDPPSSLPQVPGGSAVRQQREAPRRRGLSFQSTLQVVRLHRLQYSEK